MPLLPKLQSPKTLLTHDADRWAEGGPVILASCGAVDYTYYVPGLVQALLYPLIAPSMYQLITPLSMLILNTSL